jgi:hypothetical protein
MTRKFVGVGLAAVLATLTAAGCGGSNETTQASAPVATTSSAPATTTPGMTKTPAKQHKGKKSQSDTKSSTSSSPAAPTAAEAKWAKDLCATMRAQVQTLQPPSVNPSDPKSSVDGLVKFLDDVDAQVADQRNAIAKVGPPPIAGADRAYNRVLERLDAVRHQLQAVRQNMSKADPKNGQQLTKLFAQMGKEMQDFSSYKGPVADLVGRNAKIAGAIAAEPGCQALR